MRTSCINHPPNEPMIMAKKWQVECCDEDRCAALLLSLFEYWHNIKLEQSKKAGYQNKVARAHGEKGTQDESLLQFHNQDELENGILGYYKRNRIRDSISRLVEKGFISLHSNPSDRYKFDRTRYILFHPEAVNEWLNINRNSHELKTTHPKVNNQSSSSNNHSASSNNHSPSTENGFSSIYPEITPEASKEITSLSGLDPSTPIVAPPSVPPIVVTTPTQRGVYEDELSNQREEVDSTSELGSIDLQEETPEEESDQPSSEVELLTEVKEKPKTKTNPNQEESEEECVAAPVQPDRATPQNSKPKPHPRSNATQSFENQFKNASNPSVASWRDDDASNGFNKEVMAALHLNLKRAFGGNRPWDAADTLKWVLSREYETHKEHCILVAKVEIVVQEIERQKEHDRICKENGIVVQQPSDPPVSLEPITNKPTAGQWAEMMGNVQEIKRRQDLERNQRKASPGKTA